MILTLAISGSMSVPLLASSWNLTDESAHADWVWLGKVTKDPSGLRIGPSIGKYAFSGIRLKNPIQSASTIKIVAEFENLTVTQEAPDDLENENDMRINILLNSLPSEAWESETAVVNLSLLFNSRHGGLFMGFFGKSEGLPRKAMDPLVDGLFLGEESGKGIFTVEWVIEVEQKKLKAIVRKEGEEDKMLEAPISENLIGLFSKPLFTFVYQQNVGEGSGQFTLRKVSIE